MTGADLKTIRQSIGLTKQWCAMYLSPSSKIDRWTRWESGELDVPARIADQLAAMDAAVTAQAKFAVVTCPRIAVPT
jgi:DNA-binding transcriptional regulator YiaG